MSTVAQRSTSRWIRSRPAAVVVAAPQRSAVLAAHLVEVAAGQLVDEVAQEPLPLRVAQADVGPEQALRLLVAVAEAAHLQLRVDPLRRARLRVELVRLRPADVVLAEDNPAAVKLAPALAVAVNRELADAVVVHPALALALEAEVVAEVVLLGRARQSPAWRSSMHSLQQAPIRMWRSVRVDRKPVPAAVLAIPC